jgi:hypothetical protein
MKRVGVTEYDENLKASHGEHFPETADGEHRNDLFPTVATVAVVGIGAAVSKQRSCPDWSLASQPFVFRDLSTNRFGIAAAFQIHER